MDTIFLRFDTSAAEASRLAEDLQLFLKLNYNADLPRVRDREDSMDFGGLLAILLAAPSIVAIAKGIQVWLTKRNNIKISFEDEHRKIIGSGLSSKDIPKFFEGAKKLME